MTETALMPSRHLVPGSLVIAGLLVLTIGAVTITSPTLGMGAAIIGGSLLACGYVLVPATLLLLVLPHLAVMVLLLLQGLGLCAASCGGFVDYAYIGHLPTSFAGIILHGAALTAGLLFLRGRRVSANVYRVITGFCQGASLFFAILMIVHRHWCPSCAASHAVMAAQAILVLRLTDLQLQRQVWVLSILVGAFAVNAVFHHDLPTVTLGASEQLLGYLETVRADGQTVVVPVPGLPATSPALPNVLVPTLDAHGTAGTSSGAVSKAPVPGDSKAAANRAALVDRGTPLRTTALNQWGSSDAPVVVRASMSLVCPHCRALWADFDKPATVNGKTTSIRAMVNDRRLAVQFDFTWPIKPETHRGANLATYVVYAAGLLGEDELIAAADRFYSPEGLEFMEGVQASLLAKSVKGDIPAAAVTDALAQTFQFLDPVVPAARTLDAFRRSKPVIDAVIAGNTRWLLENGDLSTPHFFFCRSGHSGPSYLDVTTLDPEVWSTFATRGLTR